MRTIWLVLAVFFASSLISKAAEREELVEARDGKTVTTGKLIAKDKQRALLIDRTGKLHDLTLDTVRLQNNSNRFSPYTVMELRNQLASEFGKGLEIGSTRHYLVLAPAGRASEYAKVFEEQYSTLQRYFKVRGFTLTDPQFPLVAVVFPSQQKFVEYARGEGSKSMANMQGYYSPRTNRVALFESAGKSVAVSAIDSLTSPIRQMPLFGTAGSELKSTMVHEATHQVAYNIGLHSRTGETPRWVVEGMATTFEPEGMRSTLAGSQPHERINSERYLVFQNFVKSGRRPTKSLRSFIETDDLYQSSVLDFYAQSWALTFFLIETRPRNYAAYLKRIASRDPLASYPAKERLADFKETIHADVDWLDVQFVKHIDGLK